MSKDLYIADLQNRFPGHTFVETMNESAVEVEFLLIARGRPWYFGG